MFLLHVTGFLSQYQSAETLCLQVWRRPGSLDPDDIKFVMINHQVKLHVLK